MVKLEDDYWEKIFSVLNGMEEDDYYGEGVDWVEVLRLDSTEEWVLCYGEVLFEDGFKNEDEARNRLHELEKRLL